MNIGDSKIFLANPKPARIPPQTPPAGGTEAEAGRIHIPSQMFRPASSAFLSKKVRANAKITPLSYGIEKLATHATKNLKVI